MLENQRTLQGLGFALAGFALLPVGDAVVKGMAGQWPAPAIGALRYLIGATALVLLLWFRDGRAGFRCPSPWLQLGRAASVSIAATAFFIGVQIMPLADMTAISFTSPIMVALMSAIILREPPPRAVWIAGGIAFVGMIILLRPNIAAIGWAGLLPLISAAGFASMVICNRMAAGSGSALQMQMLISVLAFPMLAVIAFATNKTGVPQFAITWPSGAIILRCALIACTASLAHTLIFLATERLSAGRVAPLVYVQLLMAVTLGAAFFDELPDAGTLAGAVIIIGAGFYLWRSERITAS